MRSQRTSRGSGASSMRASDPVMIRRRGMERLAAGFDFLEAPRADGEGNLYFVDDKAVFRLRPDGSVETLLAHRPRPGGLVLHADGGLVVSGTDISHLRVDGSLR